MKRLPYSGAVAQKKFFTNLREPEGGHTVPAATSTVAQEHSLPGGGLGIDRVRVDRANELRLVCGPGRISSLARTLEPHLGFAGRDLALGLQPLEPALIGAVSGALEDHVHARRTGLAFVEAV